MSRQYWKGSALLAPVPTAMVTCGTAEHPNIITIGWCGMISTRPPRVSIAVRPERHSHALLCEHRSFVLHPTPAALTEICDYCGTVTGRCVDKIAKTGLTLIPSACVETPTIADCPLALECVITDILPQGSHDLFLADVVQVSVDDRLLDEAGKLHLERADLAAYAHGAYYRLGEKIGSIGLSVENHKKGRHATVAHAMQAQKTKPGRPHAKTGPARRKHPKNPPAGDPSAS